MRLKTFFQWYLLTATVIGVPILGGLLIVGAQRVGYTITCETLRYRCDRSLTQGIEYIAEQVSAGEDVIITPTPRKRIK